MQSYTMVSIIHMFRRVYGYVCVLCVYNTYLYAHIYYSISVYVCGERTCSFSPDIYSCIRILNMYIECRCPAYTCICYEPWLAIFFPTFCKLLSLMTYFD